MGVETYRVDLQTGEVYTYNEIERAYLFCGCLNGRTEEEFIADIERREILDDDGEG